MSGVDSVAAESRTVSRRGREEDPAGLSPGRSRSSSWYAHSCRGPSRDAKKQPENTSRENVLEMTLM